MELQTHWPLEFLYFSASFLIRSPASDWAGRAGYEDQSPAADLWSFRAAAIYDARRPGAGTSPVSPVGTGAQPG